MVFDRKKVAVFFSADSKDDILWLGSPLDVVDHFLWRSLPAIPKMWKTHSELSSLPADIQQRLQLRWSCSISMVYVGK
ncbi:hypothetical protein MKW98_006082 [Papaver atlanticum]|uniref:Uncharacterized protein n=1 Tax=Papaver atlanticum TaxID=357466 RepID=A0AAD4TGI3_9MAGN|nr:hypothetical protein MKW98_006082 [Papaver atlanticum]